MDIGRGNVRDWLDRHQAARPTAFWIKAGGASLLTLAVIGWLGEATGAPLLIAPFGSTCVLLYSAPTSPFAQPANVLGGYVIAAAIGLGLRAFLPPEWWAMAIACGLALAAMGRFRVTHPPAGGVPILIFLSAPGPGFLLVPILAGVGLMVGLAVVSHRLLLAEPYPGAGAHARPPTAPKSPEPVREKETSEP